MNKIFQYILVLLFPTLVFTLLWLIILLTNQLSLFSIPFIIIFYLVTTIFIFSIYVKNKFNLLLISFSFFIFYLFLYLGDTILSSGLLKYTMSSTLFYLYCVPFITVILFMVIVTKIIKLFKKNV